MTTLQKNNVGNFATVVRSPKSAPSFDNQKYKPNQYLFDTELNVWVSFYWIDAPFRSDSSGKQSVWLDNNAEEDNANEFGIKLTAQNLGEGKAKAAAFAMYQRQEAAAKESCAPPVHGMCCFKYYNKERRSVTTYWGYLSCVACDVDSVEESYDSKCTFNDYLSEQVDKWEKYDEISDALDAMGIYSRNILKDIASEIGLHPDDINFHEWCDENGYEQYEGVGNLRRSLENINIDHVQSDWSLIGVTTRHRSMGGDLHQANIGYWNGDLVCIDFGHHCII
jgi:hypothetical protein